MTTTHIVATPFEIGFDDPSWDRMGQVRDLLFDWDGIPDWHSGTNEWILFACEAARHVSEYLRFEGLVLDEGEHLPIGELSELLEKLFAWADERAAWETCPENRHSLTLHMCADLDLVGHRFWYDSVIAPAVDAEANIHGVGLLAESGRAAGKAYFAVYCAAIRAYYFGDERERNLILHPFE